jgi:cytochrome c oxidase cbb3-type subunit 3
MAAYEDKVLDHDVDGIREYDNPLPGWLMAIWWGSVVFSILYLGFYALAFGPSSMEAEFRAEEVADRAVLQAYYDANPLVPPSSEEILAGAADEAVLAVGRERFLKNCAACHGNLAQGLIGPNLTDDYWLHGGQVSQIFTILVKGVPTKGMPPWGRAIAPEEISALASYIRSLQGSDPPDAKGPEGTQVTPEPIP